MEDTLNQRSTNLQTMDQLQDLLDVFSGADGGVGFVKLKFGLEAFEKGAASGDKDALKILDVVLRFHKLVKVLTK